DIRTQGRPLGADALLDDLDEHLLAAPEDVLDERLGPTHPGTPAAAPATSPAAVAIPVAVAVPATPPALPPPTVPSQVLVEVERRQTFVCESLGMPLVLHIPFAGHVRLELLGQGVGGVLVLGPCWPGVLGECVLRLAACWLLVVVVVLGQGQISIVGIVLVGSGKVRLRI